MRPELQRILNELNSLSFNEVQEKLQDNMPALLQDPKFQSFMTGMKETQIALENWAAKNSDWTKLQKFLEVPSPSLAAAEKFLSDYNNNATKMYRTPPVATQADNDKLSDLVQELTQQNEVLRNELTQARKLLESILKERKRTIGFKPDTE